MNTGTRREQQRISRGKRGDSQRRRDERGACEGTMFFFGEKINEDHGISGDVTSWRKEGRIKAGDGVVAIILVGRQTTALMVW